MEYYSSNEQPEVVSELPVIFHLFSSELRLNIPATALTFMTILLFSEYFPSHPHVSV